MKKIVIYGSHYGATKAYAEYIAGRLSCPCIPADKLKAEHLKGCAAVIFGGGVYAGSIAGWKKAAPLIAKAVPEKIVLHEHYEEGCMFERNRRMVDECDLVFAYLYAKRGGTYYTVRYAEKKGKKIIFY